MLGVSAEMLDRLERNFDGWATGQGNLCTTREDMISWIDGEVDYDRGDTDLLKAIEFIKEVERKIEGEVGDVVFSK